MAVGVPVQGTEIETAAAASVAVPYPATQVGDLLLLAAVLKNSHGPTLPFPWNGIGPLPFSPAGNTVAPGIMLAWVAATGSETGTLTVNDIPGFGGAWAAQMWAIPGVDLTNPLNVAATTKDQSTSASTIVIPGATSGSDGCLLVVLAAVNNTTSTATPPASFTETADLVTGNQPIEFAYQQQTSAGATGNLTVTWSGTGKSVGVLAILNPRVVPTQSPATGTAYDATVTTTGSGFDNAPAQNTAGTGTAYDATVETNNAMPTQADGICAALDAFVLVQSLFTSITVFGNDFPLGSP